VCSRKDIKFKIKKGILNYIFYNEIVQIKLLNVITLGRGICDYINQVVIITHGFLEILCKWKL